MSNTVWVFVALVIVLGLIGAVAWLVRRFSSANSSAGANRGRMPRLAVIDAAAVDGRRRLVLVRRDNVEHLIMIGGPTDVVVEPNIQRNGAQRDVAPQRAPAGTELPARISPLPDANWQDTDAFDHREPAMPDVPQRPVRAPYLEEARRPSPPIADWNPNEADFAPEPMVRAEPPARPLPRSERTEPSIPRSERTEPRMPRANELNVKPAAPQPRAPQRQPEPLPPSADQNLADMAQRLEAALRRPGGDIRLDATETRAPAAPQARPAREPVAPRAPAPAAKGGFDNLEDEMASLLGRPKPPA